MSKKTKLPSTDAAWESGALGENEQSVRVASPQVKALIDDALGMQMISIRLEKELIDSFKTLSEFHGVGYQPLMRDALKRFADAQMKEIVSEIVQSQRTAPAKTKAQTKPAPLKSSNAKIKKAA
jgi:uncharacterized protein (DUF4415 family)